VGREGISVGLIVGFLGFNVGLLKGVKVLLGLQVGLLEGLIDRRDGCALIDEDVASIVG
jgi:hypothetical protein